MLFVRPVAISDQAEILALAQEAGIGFTSLPPDAEVLEKKIRRSVASAEGKADKNDETFLFVLEDAAKKKLVGTAGLVAHVGLKHPFYSYKLSTIVQASASVGIYSQQRVLHMVNDYTGASEIGSLFLLPAYRRDGIGKFLARFRYLVLAEFPKIFSDIVISEIRGVQEGAGESPFYRHLAQHFFQMDFKRADFINATQGGQFISDLMPKYPIYVNLLHPEAQAVIGLPLEASKPAMRLLESEGFRHRGYIDVFDGGPTMQAERAAIRAVRKSRNAKVEIGDVPATPRFIIANTSLKEFRATMAGLAEKEGSVTIGKDTAEALRVKAGDAVRFVEA